MIESIDHINIVVSDLKKAVAFFSILGFTECGASQLSGEWISSATGLPDVSAHYVRMEIKGETTRLELIQYDAPASAPVHAAVNVANEIGIRHIAFRVENIEEIVEKLLTHDIQLFGSIQTFPDTGKKLVYFIGPDGILLELAEYPQNIHP